LPLNKLESEFKIGVDATNQNYIVEDVENSGIDNVNGLRFTSPANKKELMCTISIVVGGKIQMTTTIEIRCHTSDIKNPG